MDANAINYLRRQPRSAAPRPQQAPLAPAARAPRRSLFRRLFRREEATTFHRCLAVHMVQAERESILR